MVNVTVQSHKSDKNQHAVRNLVVIEVLTDNIVQVCDPRQCIALFAGNLSINDFLYFSPILRFM